MERRLAIVLAGTSLLGQPQEITLEGHVERGITNPDGSVTFSGTGTLDMGDGTPSVPGVPFTVMVVTNTDGTGSLALSLGATNLPAATINEGYMTIK